MYGFLSSKKKRRRKRTNDWITERGTFNLSPKLHNTFVPKTDTFSCLVRNCNYAIQVVPLNCWDSPVESSYIGLISVYVWFHWKNSFKFCNLTDVPGKFMQLKSHNQGRMFLFRYHVLQIHIIVNDFILAFFSLFVGMYIYICPECILVYCITSILPAHQTACISMRLQRPSTVKMRKD